MVLTPEDRTLLQQQMGRTPQGVVDVPVRCGNGHPCVITSYPLRRRNDRVVPFPTLYWLVCPELSAKVAHLERDGAIGRIAAELARNDDLRAALAENHQQYIAARWALLTRDDQQALKASGQADDLRTLGISGMFNHAAVKCLHAHVAHHLVSGNVIGSLVMQRHNLKTCGCAK